MKVLTDGVPDAAYKPLTGDDKAAARYYATRNRQERGKQGLLDFARGGGTLRPEPLAKAWADLRALPEDSAEQIAEKQRRFGAIRANRLSFAWDEAADLYVAAFLLPKQGGEPPLGAAPTLPTSGDVWRALADKQVHPSLVAHAVEASRAAEAFHWPLEFPDVMAAGGFDVVLGNPPWERLKLQEQEFFASRDSEIAAAPTAAARGEMIAALGNATLGTPEHALHEEFEAAKRLAEATSVFARESGRFPLTGRGDVNTYALFAEHFANLASSRGRAGVIVPTGIATDATTAPFFAAMIESRRISALYSFENEEMVFPAVHHAMKFCLLTLKANEGIAEPEFVFFARSVIALADERRRFTLSAADIARINPNTKTAPVFRARADAELTAKIYARVPVFIEEAQGTAGNPWAATFHTRIWHMAEDSAWFRTSEQLKMSGFVPSGSLWKNGIDCYVPLYEAKLIQQFDHRWGTYYGADSRDVTTAEKHDTAFEPMPRYWVPEKEVKARLAARNWGKNWLTGWRDITNATNERTVIAAAFPRVASGHTLPLAFIDQPTALVGCLLANLAVFVVDFVARQKIGGTHLTYGYLTQLPVLPPSAYTARDLAFIVPRVLELTYTSHAMAPFAHDLGYDGPPFAWNEDRRAMLRAELDAFYGRAYGLTRDELRYVLDPEDALGSGYPSETFRVLKQNEIRRFGKFRTADFVLNAWDRMEAGEFVDIVPGAPVIAGQPTDVAPRPAPDLASLPDRDWARGNEPITAAAVQAQLAAIMKAFGTGTPAATVRRAVLFAIEPRYLTQHLKGKEQQQWRRLVGPAAEPIAGAAALTPSVNATWRDAETQLVGMGAIVFDPTTQQWSPGPQLDGRYTEGWPDGRAGFVVKAIGSIEASEIDLAMPTEDLAWVRGDAAA